MVDKKLVGYKMVRPDGTSFYDSKTVYVVGKILRMKDATADGLPCGHGLHLAKEKHGPMKYNAVWPWRLMECSYAEKDVVGQDADKVRVRKLKIERELDPTDIGLPRANQFFDRLERLKNYTGLKAQTPARKKNIAKAMYEHVKRLNTHPAAYGRVIVLTRVEFHGVAEWGSIWDSVRNSVSGSVWDSVSGSVWDSVSGSVRNSVSGSVWDSVRGSVWASVWDSVWDSVWASVWGTVRGTVRGSVWGSVKGSVVLDDGISPFVLEHDILDYGAVLYGIDGDGVAHVVMPTKEEVARDG